MSGGWRARRYKARQQQKRRAKRAAFRKIRKMQKPRDEERRIKREKKEAIKASWRNFDLIPFDLLVMLFSKFFDPVAAIRLQRVSKRFLSASKRARELEEWSVAALQREKQRAALIVAMRERQANVKNRAGVPYPPEVWDLCDGCGRTYRVEKIARHQMYNCKGPRLCRRLPRSNKCRCHHVYIMDRIYNHCKDVARCKWCECIFPNSEDSKHRCPLEPVICNTYDCEVSMLIGCGYKDLRFRMQVHERTCKPKCKKCGEEVTNLYRHMNTRRECGRF